MIRGIRKGARSRSSKVCPHSLRSLAWLLDLSEHDDLQLEIVLGILGTAIVGTYAYFLLTEEDPPDHLPNQWKLHSTATTTEFRDRVCRCSPD